MYTQFKQGNPLKFTKVKTRNLFILDGRNINSKRYCLCSFLHTLWCMLTTFRHYLISTQVSFEPMLSLKEGVRDLAQSLHFSCINQNLWKLSRNVTLSTKKKTVILQMTSIVIRLLYTSLTLMIRKHLSM